MFENFSARRDEPQVNRRLQRMAERASRGRPIDPDEPDPDQCPAPGAVGERAPPVDEDAPGAAAGDGSGGRSSAAPHGGRLVQRWSPDGSRLPHQVLAAVRRRPGWLLAGVGVLVAAITATSMLGGTPKPQAAPRLPPAVSTPSATAASSAAATPSKLIVSVVGKVANPGLVTLSGGARVADALHAAGGVATGAKITALNLARRLADGEQIYVGIPVPPGASAAPPVPGSSAAAGPGAVPGAPGGKLDLNTATADQLDELPGIGEVTAQSILDWRAENGRFASVGQLNDVDGIGEVRFGELKDLVEVR